MSNEWTRYARKAVQRIWRCDHKSDLCAPKNCYYSGRIGSSTEILLSVGYPTSKYSRIWRRRIDLTMDGEAFAICFMVDKTAAIEWEYWHEQLRAFPLG
jgi:hypothetical protein